MSIQRTLLLKALVTPFYRQNGGLLCFIFFIMVFAVGRANGVGLLEYHYSLVHGMLTNCSFLLTVLVMWLIYALRCTQHVTRTVRKAEFQWLYLLAQENKRKVYSRLLQVQVLLFLPVFAYLFFILKIGYREHLYAATNTALLFTLFICVASAGWYLYLLHKQGVGRFAIRWRLPSFPQQYYTRFLFNYLLANNKVLLLVIKAYNCITLYLMMDLLNAATGHDLRMPALFFSFGMLGHGVLIHRMKEMENSRLHFYRSLPVSLTRRFAQYGWFYFCIFLPELIAIAARTPANVTYGEACFFIFFGYGILMLLNSLQLFNYKGLKDYLQVVVQLLFVVMIGMVANCMYVVAAVFCVLAVVLFFRRYYLFEPVIERP